MKKLSFNLVMALILMAGLVFAGCQSPQQKADSAQTQLQDAEQKLADAEQNKSVADQNAVDAEEWEQFRIDTEAKITANEIRIAELRQKKKNSDNKLAAVYTERIDALEQKNMGMRTWMYDYENSKTDWALFKREFNHDMDELGKSLKNPMVDNKN